MADLKSQIEFTADASGVETGVAKAKRSLASLGAAAKTEGAKAAKGLEAVGAGGETAATKVDGATRNMVGSIQRQIAALEAGSKSGADYYRVLAEQRGLNVGILKPYLDQLNAVEARTKAAAKATQDLSRLTTSLGATSFQKQLGNPTTSLGASGFGEVPKQLSAVQSTAAAATAELKKGGVEFNKYGKSVKETQMALRGVPAQLTDIMVGLQGGQAPLTVLLQQGGQLRDMFGGVVPAFKAIGSAALGLVNPFTLAAGAVAALGFAYFQGSKESDAYAKALILSGNAAGKTLGQLNAMAERISAISGTQAAAAAAVAEFAASGTVAGNSIERFSLLALRMEKATGQAVAETRKQFEELGKSPVAASIKLNEQTNYLTASLYKQIRALEEQGRTTEAAALAQKGYADAMDQRLNGVTQRLGYVERAWNSVAGAAKWAWDKMLNVGRESTLEDQIAKSAAEVNRLQGLVGSSIVGGGGAARAGMARRAQAELSTEQARLDALREQQRLMGSVADRQRESAAQVKARIEFDKEGDQYLTNRAKMERDIAKARQQGLAAGATQAEIEKRIAGIREKYADKGGDRAARMVDRAELGFDIQVIKNEAEAMIGTYANSERIVESIRSAGLMNDREYYEAKRAFIALESQAKEDALQKEIDRYRQEKLTGKDKIDNDRKIAEATAKLAMVRADTSARQVVLSNQVEAANRREAASLLTLRQAAQDYYDSIILQQERRLAGTGRGTQQRDRDAGINQIEDRYAAQRRDLENQRAQLELEGRFTDEARAQYEQRLAIINEFQAKSIASFNNYYDRLLGQQRNWSNGALEAINNYLDGARNVAQQVEDVFSNAFKGMEDALVSFITTGKLDFKGLANSIIADITRMIVKQQVMLPILRALRESSGENGPVQNGGGFMSFLGSLLGGPRAIGGPVSAGRMYPVNERRPELLDVGGKQYLMMGSQSGVVSSNGDSKAQHRSLVVQVTPPAGMSSETAYQYGRRIGEGIAVSTERNG